MYMYIYTDKKMPVGAYTDPDVVVQEILGHLLARLWERCREHHGLAIVLQRPWSQAPCNFGFSFFYELFLFIFFMLRYLLIF